MGEGGPSSLNSSLHNSSDTLRCLECPPSWGYLCPCRLLPRGRRPTSHPVVVVVGPKSLTPLYSRGPRGVHLLRVQTISKGPLSSNSLTVPPHTPSTSVQGEPVQDGLTVVTPTLKSPYPLKRRTGPRPQYGRSRPSRRTKGVVLRSRPKRVPTPWSLGGLVGRLYPVPLGTPSCGTSLSLGT